MIRKVEKIKAIEVAIEICIFASLFCGHPRILLAARLMLECLPFEVISLFTCVRSATASLGLTKCFETSPSDYHTQKVLVRKTS